MSIASPQPPLVPTPIERTSFTYGYRLLAGVVLILLLTLLPGSLLPLSWRALGYLVLILGVGYGFFLRNAQAAILSVIIFTGLFEAPIRYLTADRTEILISYIGRDIIIYGLTIAVVIYRLITSRNSSVRDVPPFIFLVLCFCLNLFIQCFNPNSLSPLASLLNARIFWEMIPLYFLGYYYMRDVKSWKTLMLTYAVCATVSGVVAVHQGIVGFEKVATWGPGYYRQIKEFQTPYEDLNNDIRSNFRPMGLASDSAVIGGSGAFAIPMALAFLPLFRRFTVGESQPELKGRFLEQGSLYFLVAGTFLTAFASGSRSAIVFGVIASITTAILANGARLQGRFIVALGGLGTIAFAAFLIVQGVAPNLLNRYESISSVEKLAGTFNQEGRGAGITAIPINLAFRHPLGAGLDNLGPGAAFVNSALGTPYRPQFENTENTINLSIVGLGLPGLVVWLVLNLSLLVACWSAQKSLVATNTEDRELLLFIRVGLSLMVLCLFNWPFGSLVGYPQNMMFWLIPGMILGSVSAFKQRSTVEVKKNS